MLPQDWRLGNPLQAGSGVLTNEDSLALGQPRVWEMLQPHSEPRTLPWLPPGSGHPRYHSDSPGPTLLTSPAELERLDRTSGEFKGGQNWIRPFLQSHGAGEDLFIRWEIDP